MWGTKDVIDCCMVLYDVDVMFKQNFQFFLSVMLEADPSSWEIALKMAN